MRANMQPFDSFNDLLDAVMYESAMRREAAEDRADNAAAPPAATGETGRRASLTTSQIGQVGTSHRRSSVIGQQLSRLSAVSDVAIPQVKSLTLSLPEDQIIALIQYLSQHAILKDQTNVTRDDLEQLILTCHDIDQTKIVLSSIESAKLLFDSFDTLQAKARQIYADNRLMELKSVLSKFMTLDDIAAIAECCTGEDSPLNVAPRIVLSGDAPLDESEQTSEHKTLAKNWQHSAWSRLVKHATFTSQIIVLLVKLGTVNTIAQATAQSTVIVRADHLTRGLLYLSMFHDKVDSVQGMLNLVKQRKLDADKASAVLSEAMADAKTHPEHAAKCKVNVSSLKTQLEHTRATLDSIEPVYDALHTQVHTVLDPFYAMYNQQTDMLTQFSEMTSTLQRVIATDDAKATGAAAPRDAMSFNDSLPILTTFLNSLQSFFSTLPSSFLTHLQTMFDSFEQWLYLSNSVTSILFPMLTQINFDLDTDPHALPVVCEHFLQPFLPLSLSLSRHQALSAYLFPFMSDLLSMTGELVPFLDELTGLFAQFDVCAANSQKAYELQKSKATVANATSAAFDGQASSPDSSDADESTQAHVLIGALQPFKLQLFTYLTELRPFLSQLLDSSYHFNEACIQTRIGWMRGIQPMFKKLMPFLQQLESKEDQEQDAKDAARH